MSIKASSAFRSRCSLLAPEPEFFGRKFHLICPESLDLFDEPFILVRKLGRDAKFQHVFDSLSWRQQVRERSL